MTFDKPALEKLRIRSRSLRRLVSNLPEPLETRALLSGYSFGIAAQFTPSFNVPQGNVVLDSSGNLYGVVSQGGANAKGGIFELANGTSTPTLLASFPANFTSGELTIDGAGNLYGFGTTITPTNDVIVYELPAGQNAIETLADLGDNNVGPQFNTRLTVDSTGNVYGVTAVGGANREGEIIKVVKGSGTATTLASFPNVGSDGIPGTLAPNGDLQLDSSGDLFGTTSGAGAFGTGDGTIFELPVAASSITTIYTFTGSTTGSAPADMVMDSHGNLFGDLMNNNSYTHQAIGGIFELSAGASVPTIAASFNSATGFNSFYPLTIDSSGDLFGASEFGGAVSANAADGLGVVFELPANAQSITTLTTFNLAANNGAFPTGAVAIDSSGDIYGAAPGPGQSSSGIVYKLTPGGPGGGGSSSLSATLTGALAANSLIAGQKAAITQKLTLTDTGAGPVTGTATAKFYLSTDGAVDASSVTLPITASKHLNLKAGKAISLVLHIKSIPAGTPNGSYQIIAQVTDPSDNIIDAATSGTIVVAPAQVDLTGSFAKASPSTVKTGKKVSLSFTLTNTGNIPAAGSLPIQVDLSTVNADNQNLKLPEVDPKINIKPGKTAKITIHQVIAVPDGSYFLFITLDPGNSFPNVIDPASIFASSTAVLTVTG